MLCIHYGKNSKKYIENSSVFFNNTYEDEWLNDSLVKDIICGIDKSEVITPHLIESPVLGGIPVEKISGGAKTVMLMLKTDRIFCGDSCGDNCAEWILKIAEQKDIYLPLNHFMKFGEGPYEIKIDNTEVIVHNDRECFSEYLKCRGDIE